MKRGDVTFSLVTLMEVVLAIVVVATIYFSVQSMVTNTSYFQSFFAKDNSHLIEALHAVPNGDVHLGYLWASPSFLLSVYNQQVSVSKASIVAGKVFPDSPKTKAFGSSQNLTIGEAPGTPIYSFQPDYYQYLLTGGEQRSLLIESQFNKLTCPGSRFEFTHVTVSGQGQGFTDSQASEFAAAVQASVAVHLVGKAGAAVPAIAVLLANSPVEENAVYYTTNDDSTLRLACTIATSLSGTQNARYGHISQAPANLQALHGDVIVLITATDDQLQNRQNNLTTGIIAATQVQS